jgi:hypothetical protein
MAVDPDEIEKILSTAGTVKEKCREELLKEGFPEVRLKRRELKQKERELEHHLELKSREMEHAERMRALETGQPLPEAFVTRIRAAGSIGTLVPIAVATAAAASSVMLFQNPPPLGATAPPDLQMIMLGVIWGVSGLVVLLTVWMTLHTLRCLGKWSSGGKEPVVVERRFTDSPVVVTPNLPPIPVESHSPNPLPPAPWASSNAASLHPDRSTSS